MAEDERNTTATDKREAEWGHWGILFLTTHSPAYADATLHGHVYFPVGTRGPCDGPNKTMYRELIRCWCEEGTLPASLVPWRVQ